MRRQKRDVCERAFQKGYQAGLSGRSRDFCPHEQLETRQQWLSGWREGRTDNRSGLTGVSSLHRLQLG